MQEVMASLLPVDCDVLESVCLLGSNNSGPTVNGQRTASTCASVHVAHNTLGFPRCHSKFADRPFLRSVSHMRERRHGMRTVQQ